MRTARQVIVVLLVTGILAYGQGNTFDKIRYNGGTIKTNVSPKNWDNRLTVSSGEITLQLKDGQVLRIDPNRVSSLSYGQEARRRMSTVIGLYMFLGPFALLGWFKSRYHFVGIEFTTEEGKKSAVLLQAGKDNYRAVLMALRGATGAPIAVAEEDRKFVPMGVEVVTAKGSEETSSQPEEEETPTVPTPAAAVAPETASVVLKSTPSEAEVMVDGKYVGNTTSTLLLEPGEHTITVRKVGFTTWQRTMTASAGGNVTIHAPLEPEAKALRLDQLIGLLAGGVPETRLIQLVKERGVDFPPNDASEQSLRGAGAGDTLIQAIREANSSSPLR